MQSGLLDDKMNNKYCIYYWIYSSKVSSLAQLVERETVNLKVVGSTPTRGVSFGLFEVVRNVGPTIVTSQVVLVSSVGRPRRDCLEILGVRSWL